MSSSQNKDNKIKLTEYSHGAGCGCKLSPAVLSDVLRRFKSELPDISGMELKNMERLIVGTENGDDAAVFQLDSTNAIINTTDFFMPIVDDAFLFGKIAATNALSDVYAMGGRPLMAISILGWPINKLSAELAGTVVQGAQSVCTAAGIIIAGGHSIDSPEPIFGLAVTGHVKPDDLLTNAGARPDDLIYLTKPLGIGILTTAQKQKKLKTEHASLASEWMGKLNKIGYDLAQTGWLHAMTDVTGFGLAGHLLEVCRASQLGAEITLDSVPVIESVRDYLRQGCIPGGTGRNFESYGDRIISELKEADRNILCDPQTSGGLLLFCKPTHKSDLEKMLIDHDIQAQQIGHMLKEHKAQIKIL